MRESNKKDQLRKQYKPPQVVHYGSIRELTKGGTAQTAESMDNKGKGFDKT